MFSTNGREARIGRPASTTSTGAAASRVRRGREAGGAHGQHLLRVGRLHGLQRVAGIDRPLEGVGRHDLDHLADLHHVEERRDPRQHVLAGRRRRRDDRVVAAGERRRSAPPSARRAAPQARRPRRAAPCARRRAARPPRRRRPAALPATSTSTSPPIRAAALSALAVWSESVALSCSAKRRMAMSLISDLA